MGIAICSKSCKDSFMYQFHCRRTSAGISHIGFRIVYDHGICLSDQFHFMFIDIDTVSQKRLWSKNIPVIQTIHDTFIVFFQALMKIIDSLCHMNMIAHALRFQFITEFHCLIRDCKRCMHTHHRCQHVTVFLLCMLNEIYVLHHGLSGFLHSISV